MSDYSYAGYKLTPKAERVIAAANVRRHQVGQCQLGTDHVLYGLAATEGTVAHAALVEHDVTPEALGAFDSPVNTTPPATTADPNDHTQNLLGRADTVRVAYDHDFVGTEHLLLALVSPKFGDPSSSGFTQLTRRNVDPKAVAASVVRLLNRDPVLVGLPAAPPQPEKPKPTPASTVANQIAELNATFLQQLTALLTPPPAAEPPLTGSLVRRLIERAGETAAAAAAGPMATVSDDLLASLQEQLDAAATVLDGVGVALGNLRSIVAARRLPSA